jgi:glycine cleavage system transcriptional repressor
MTIRYILTLTAANRVGILAAVTNALAELGGNLHEVSQTVVQRFFTIILAVDFPQGLKPEVIVDHIRDIGRPYGIEVCLKNPAQEALPDDAPAPSAPHFLVMTGYDQPGLIRRLSARLAQDGIDITDLCGLRDEQRQSFVIAMELAVPLTAEVPLLRRDLEQLANSLGVFATLYDSENLKHATEVPTARALARQTPSRP